MFTKGSSLKVARMELVTCFTKMVTATMELGKTIIFTAEESSCTLVETATKVSFAKDRSQAMA